VAELGQGHADLSGARFLALHWRLAGGDPARTESAVAEAADRVGLERPALARRLKTYSRGMLQRIGVAQATLRDPDLLFLDEPASGADPLGVAIIRDRILDARKRGATVVLNSHQLPEVERVCDRVVFIDHGRLTREETLTGESASRRRAAIRVPVERAIAASEALAAAGCPAEAADGGVLRLASADEAAVSAAVKALALADVPVLEVRSSAELEELFRPGGAS